MNKLKMSSLSLPTGFRRSLMLGNAVFEHHAYSLALLPHNFHISGPFTSDNDVQETVVEWFRQQHKEIFADGMC
jgi:hypothetical protein